MYGLSKSYDHTTTARRAVADVVVQSHCTRCTVAAVGRLAFRVAQKRCDLLRSPFWCDRKTAIERDHAATEFTFSGDFDPQTLFFVIETPTMHILGRIRVV